MSVHSHSYEYQNMTVTYEQIRERREELDKERDERKGLIRGAVRKLSDMYIDSLGLKGMSWKTISGQAQEYVYFRQDGRRYPAPENIGFTENYIADFKIVTVIDDTPRGGDAVEVDVDIYVLDDELHIDVGSADDLTRKEFVVDPENEAQMQKVCDALKDATLMKIVDPGLEA